MHILDCVCIILTACCPKIYIIWIHFLHMWILYTNIIVSGAYRACTPTPQINQTYMKTRSGASPQNYTNTMYVDAHTQILLQTAVLWLVNPTVSLSIKVQVRAIMDSGSQHTYITSHTREALQLATKRTKCLSIKTLITPTQTLIHPNAYPSGPSGEEWWKAYELFALVVPFICPPMTSQSVKHLQGAPQTPVGVGSGGHSWCWRCPWDYCDRGLSD